MTTQARRSSRRRTCKESSLEASYDSAVGQFPDHRNSVGFLPHTTCPGATWEKGGCATVCYARNGRGRMPTVLNRLMRNTAVLLDYCLRDDTDGLTEEFLLLLDAAHAQYERRLRSETRKGTNLCRQLRHRGSLFRFQWAGDLAHAVHAQAVRDACQERPEITSWLYTRSFHLVKHLEPKPTNLTVWLSSDDQNERQALNAHRRFPWTRLAYMTTNAEVGIVCPKYRYLPTERACARCGICFQSTATEISFPTST